MISSTYYAFKGCRVAAVRSYCLISQLVLRILDMADGSQERFSRRGDTLSSGAYVSNSQSEKNTNMYSLIRFKLIIFLDSGFPVQFVEKCMHLFSRIDIRKQKDPGPTSDEKCTT